MAVTQVNEDQQDDGTGNLVDVYEVTFTIPGQNGSFNTTVPRSGDPVAAAKASIDAITAQVEGILAL